MQQCPTCGSPRVYRSRSRKMLERLRKLFTADRLHRCHACGWRGWGPAISRTDHDEGQRPPGKPLPDLAAIDSRLAMEPPTDEAGQSS